VERLDSRIHFAHGITSCDGRSDNGILCARE